LCIGIANDEINILNLLPKHVVHRIAATTTKT
jgi:hypothetical protein